MTEPDCLLNAELIVEAGVRPVDEEASSVADFNIVYKNLIGSKITQHYDEING